MRFLPSLMRADPRVESKQMNAQLIGTERIVDAKKAHFVTEQRRGVSSVCPLHP